jgi:hypothetical protein
VSLNYYSLTIYDVFILIIIYYVHNMRTTPFIGANIIKSLRIQIFVDISQEGVNHGKTCVMFDELMHVYFLLMVDHI